VTSLKGKILTAASRMTIILLSMIWKQYID